MAGKGLCPTGSGSPRVWLTGVEPRSLAHGRMGQRAICLSLNLGRRCPRRPGCAREERRLPCSMPPVGLPPATKKKCHGKSRNWHFPGTVMPQRLGRLGVVIRCTGRIGRSGSAEGWPLATSFSPCSPPPRLAARSSNHPPSARPPAVETAFFPFDRPTLPARYQKFFKLCQLRSDSTAQAFALLSPRDSRLAASCSLPFRPCGCCCCCCLRCCPALPLPPPGLPSTPQVLVKSPQQVPPGGPMPAGCGCIPDSWHPS
jgi:hypothetical protein